VHADAQGVAEAAVTPDRPTDDTLSAAAVGSTPNPSERAPHALSLLALALASCSIVSCCIIRRRVKVTNAKNAGGVEDANRSALEEAEVAAARRMQRAHQRKAKGRRGRQKKRYVELEELTTPGEGTRTKHGRLDDLDIDL